MVNLVEQKMCCATLLMLDGDTFTEFPDYYYLLWYTLSFVCGHSTSCVCEQFLSWPYVAKRSNYT